MNYLHYRIHLDMFEAVSQKTIKAKKGDTACSIIITLTEHGKIYNIPDDCHATFTARKPDGTILYNAETCRIEDNAIVYDFTKQTTACEGNVECEVVLYKGDMRLTSPLFTLFVGDTVYNVEDVLSAPEADALVKLLIETNEELDKVYLKKTDGISLEYIEGVTRSEESEVYELSKDLRIPRYEDKIDELEKSKVVVDSALNINSNNPVANKVLTPAINMMQQQINANKVTVDSELSIMSTNPVQNRIVTAELTSVKNNVSSLTQDVSRVNESVDVVAGRVTEAEKLIGLHSNYVTPQMYGAKADGTTNDSAAFKAMIDGNPDGTVFFIPAGTYAVNLTSNARHGYWYSPLDVYQRNDLTFIFANGAKLVAMTDNISNLQTALLNIAQSNNIKVVGGEFVGWRQCWDASNGTKIQYGIVIDCSNDVWVNGVSAHDCVASGIIVCGDTPSRVLSEKVLIENSKFYETYYHGVVIEGGKHVVLDNVSAWSATLADYACSIDIEGRTVDLPNEDIICKGCNFGASNGRSVSLHKNKGVTLVDCFIEDWLNINSGTDYLIDGCEIHGGITNGVSDQKNPNIIIPNFENTVVQNCVVYGLIAFTCQSFTDAVCDTVFKNNTFYTDTVAYNRNGFSTMFKKGRCRIQYIENLFNILSVPSADYQVFNIIGGAEFVGNTFNIGNENNVLAIDRFWYHQTSGKIILDKNVFNTFSKSNGSPYLIVGAAAVPMVVTNNVFCEKGTTFSPVALCPYGAHVVCTGNTFLLNRTFAIYDTAATTNVYAHNTFNGNNALYLTNKKEEVIGDNCINGSSTYARLTEAIGTLDGLLDTINGEVI